MSNIVYWNSDAKYLILKVNLQYNQKYSHLETVVDEKSHDICLLLFLTALMTCFDAERVQGAC